MVVVAELSLFLYLHMSEQFQFAVSVLLHFLLHMHLLEQFQWTVGGHNSLNSKAKNRKRNTLN